MLDFRFDRLTESGSLFCVSTVDASGTGTAVGWWSKPLELGVNSRGLRRGRATGPWGRQQDADAAGDPEDDEEGV